MADTPDEFADLDPQQFLRIRVPYERAEPVSKRNGHDPEEIWPEPEPLFANHEKPEPYPVEALPPVMRDAVVAYQTYGQQPIEMVACSAISAASLGCQALADVDRDGNLRAPCSLSLLTVAVSGERKTAADKRLRRPITDWQEQRRQEDAPTIQAAERRLTVWEAARDGMLAKIKKCAGSTKPNDEQAKREVEEALIKHDLERPRVPAVVKLFYEDVTPERLATALARGWPSASLWSDEGGLVIGSHAMSEDAALRFLALLNRLWDGNPFDRDRETAACAHIRGRRFTTSLMVQPHALATLVSAGDGVARGIGALARNLMCWPTSTMGTRLYNPGDSECPELSAYDARLRSLLEMPLPVGPDGALDPPVLRLSSGAFEVWRSLHDDVERELSRHGEFGELPDFGAKIAEQAARIACVFHVFEHGPAGEIGTDTMVSAGRVATWHLHEARRVLGMIGQSGEASDAQTLLEWLLERTTPLTLREIQRKGPYRLRDRKRRDQAIAKLGEHGMARVEKHGRAEHIHLNPACRP